MVRFFKNSYFISIYLIIVYNSLKIIIDTNIYMFMVFLLIMSSRFAIHFSAIFRTSITVLSCTYQRLLEQFLSPRPVLTRLKSIGFRSGVLAGQLCPLMAVLLQLNPQTYGPDISCGDQNKAWCALLLPPYSNFLVLIQTKL